MYFHRFSYNCHNLPRITTQFKSWVWIASSWVLPILCKPHYLLRNYTDFARGVFAAVPLSWWLLWALDSPSCRLGLGAGYFDFTPSLLFLVSLNLIISLISIYIYIYIYYCWARWTTYPLSRLRPVALLHTSICYLGAFIGFSGSIWGGLSLS